MPRERLTTADNRRARSVLLRKADLIASLRVDRKRTGVPAIPHCTDYPGDRSSITITGDASSAFSDGHNTIGSTALFFKSDTDIDRYWKTTVRPRFATCDADAYKTTLRKDVTPAHSLRVGFH
jgi:hypothetical protein